MTRFRAMSTLNAQKRFVDSIISYAMAASKQTGFRERNLRPSVEEYVALRRETGGVMVCTSLFMKREPIADQVWIQDMHAIYRKLSRNRCP